MTQKTERILWSIGALCVVLAVVGWRYGVPTTGTATGAEPAATPTIMMFHDSQIAAAGQQTTTHNPFRLNRSPANVPFGTPDVPPAPPPPPPPSPLATVALKGIVGGPPWRAILSGVPGRERNVVVNTGDTLGGIRIKQVRHDRIILADKDSAITLTLRRVWQ